MDLQVMQVDPITGKVSFGLAPRALTGAEKLTQIVVLSLMTVPGRDVLDPSKGGGLPDLLGYSVGDDSVEELKGEIVRKVNKTAAEITLSQVGKDLSDSERLREIRVLSVARGEAIDEIIVRLRIINESGRTVDISV